MRVIICCSNSEDVPAPVGDVLASGEDVPATVFDWPPAPVEDVLAPGEDVPPLLDVTLRVTQSGDPEATPRLVSLSSPVMMLAEDCSLA